MMKPDDGLLKKYAQVMVNYALNNGHGIKKGDTVLVHYTGRFKNGMKFDSSYDHPDKEPLEFTIGTSRVIQGWHEGIPGMKIGGSRKLIIPPALGYGDQGSPPTIPGNASLVFIVDLKSIDG